MHIKQLAGEIGLDKISLVGNKIRGEKDKQFLEKNLSDFDFLGFLPFDDSLIEADLDGRSPYESDSFAKTEIMKMIEKL
jgi:CO dehydrogenase maturation factor